MGDPEASLRISARGSFLACPEQLSQGKLSNGPPKCLKLGSTRCYKVMSPQTTELDGFEIELASEHYCERGGDHRELVDRARTDRARLGHNVDESAVLCVRCMRAIALKA